MKKKNIFNKTSKWAKSFTSFLWCENAEYVKVTCCVTDMNTHRHRLTDEDISWPLCNSPHFWCSLLYSGEPLLWHTEHFPATLKSVSFCVSEHECAASVEVWVSVEGGRGVNLVLFFNLVINLTAWQMDTISCLPPYDTNMPHYKLLCGIPLGKKRH